MHGNPSCASPVPLEPMNIWDEMNTLGSNTDDAFAASGDFWRAAGGDECDAEISSDIDLLLREFISDDDDMSATAEGAAVSGGNLLGSCDSSDGTGSGSWTGSPDHDDGLSGAESMDESLMELIGCVGGESTAALSPTLSPTLSPSICSSPPSSVSLLPPLSPSLSYSSSVSSDSHKDDAVSQCQSRRRQLKCVSTSAPVTEIDVKVEHVAEHHVVDKKRIHQHHPPPSTSSTSRATSAAPLVVPVSVRGVGGTVRAVRVLPVTPNNNNNNNNNIGVIANGARCGRVGGDVNSRGDLAQCRRVIRVIKAASTTSSSSNTGNSAGLSLPVIKVSRAAVPSSSLPAHTVVKIVDHGAGGGGGASASAAEMARLSVTAEERRLLQQEGVPVPSHWPLTRQEEHNLKRIRRKIRNKVSAQDSRKRKKEYYDCLEEKVRTFTEENRGLHKRMRHLEGRNAQLAAHNNTLAAQLKQSRRLHQQQQQQQRPLSAGDTTKTRQPPAACLLVLLISLCVCLMPQQQQQQQQQQIGNASTVADMLLKSQQQQQQHSSLSSVLFDKSGGMSARDAGVLSALVHQLSVYVNKQQLKTELMQQQIPAVSLTSPQHHNTASSVSAAGQLSEPPCGGLIGGGLPAVACGGATTGSAFLAAASLGLD